MDARTRVSGNGESTCWVHVLRSDRSETGAPPEDGTDVLASTSMRALITLVQSTMLLACGGTTDIGGRLDASSDAPMDISPDPGEDTTVSMQPQEAPLTFRILNSTYMDLYLDWTFEGRTAVHGMRSGALVTGGANDFSWFHPSCTEDCDAILPGGCGCVECEPMLPSARRLAPGESVAVTWTDPVVYHLFMDDCGCFCAQDTPLMGPCVLVVAGVARSGYACYDCVVDGDGIITGASVDGTRFCARTSTAIPTDPGEIVLSLTGDDCGLWPEP